MTARTCDEYGCTEDISHKHRFSRYCDVHSTSKPERVGLTRQQAINAHCRDCICDELDVGTWRQQVTACSFTACNLYGFRPVSKPKAVEP